MQAFRMMDVVDTRAFAVCWLWIDVVGGSVVGGSVVGGKMSGMYDDWVAHGL